MKWLFPVIKTFKNGHDYNLPSFIPLKTIEIIWLHQIQKMEEFINEMIVMSVYLKCKGILLCFSVIFFKGE